MRRLSLVPFITLVILLAAAAAGAATFAHHELTVSLDPAAHVIRGRDTYTLPAERQLPADGTIEFSLHAGLNPASSDPAVRLTRIGVADYVETWRIALPAGRRAFTLDYGGAIDHPLEQVGEEYARGQKDTVGAIRSEGIYLSASSAWYPSTGDELMTFNLEVNLPAGWDVVSQGARTRYEPGPKGTTARWESPEPQDDIYLVGGRYTEYRRKVGGVEAQVFLRTPDEKLARTYLDATARSLALYDQLIGPYAYRKFALVENFWETGNGMPSFTLLGPQVVRLPFIPVTSYPHEILHNWWGNGVYVDYAQGNWCEGLTAYLADHLFKEQQGIGADARREILQKYADFVISGRDLPLTGFTARHSSVTEAVGYGKALFLFHMLRRDLGDEMFIAGLRELYTRNLFRRAAWSDVRQAFETVAKRDLKPFFAQWVERTGAPALKLASARAGSDGVSVTCRIEQTQAEEPYRLRVPLLVTVAGRAEGVRSVVELSERTGEFTLTGLPGKPLRIDLDPEFDLFRRLDRGEIPLALTTIFGAAKLLIVLPAQAPADRLKAYRELAVSISGSGPGSARTVSDADLKELPGDESVVILGWENRFFPRVREAMKMQGAQLSQQEARLASTTLPRADHTLVAALPHPGNAGLAMLWIGLDQPQAAAGLGRKLPHYQKYSYLGFEGDEPANVLKGRWPVLSSPLTLILPDGGTIGAGTLPPRPALAQEPALFSTERMMETIRFLTAPELKGRALSSPELDRVSEYLAARFKTLGLQPAGDMGSFTQSWTADWGTPPRQVPGRNVIGYLPGTDADWAGQSLVVGSHFDGQGLGLPSGRSEDRGSIHPGADDNASGVAVLLELAAYLREMKPKRSVVFALFSGEEEGQLGSRRYLEAAKLFPASKIIGMLDLDTVGRLGKKKLLALGSPSAREWVHIFRGVGFVTGTEVELPSNENEAGDSLTFIRAGIPAIQLFSGPHLDYHRPGDTADKLDYDGMAKVAAVAKEVVEYLADRADPLTKTGGAQSGGSGASGGSTTSRAVTFGSVPDFAFSGQGVRLSGTSPGSPAEKAGLREGDVITAINGAAVKSLRDFSEILKGLKSGDKVTVTYTRNGARAVVESHVEAR